MTCKYFLTFSGLSFLFWIVSTEGFPDGSDGKESTCNAGDLGSIPGLGKSPGGRAWQPIPVFLPGESHGQRRLAGYLDMTGRLSTA